MYNKLFFISLFLFLSSQGLFSQVTVGSAIKPNEGALLDVKQSTTTDGSANSTKGIGLPRVALTAIDDLSPCADNTSDNKLSHRGLTVYNVTDNSDGAQTLKEGLYFWDGDLWQPSGLKAMQGFGPWYQVDNPTIPSREVTTDSYLNAKAVVGGTDVINDAALSVHDNNGTSSTAAFGTSNSVLDLTATNKGFMIPKIELLDTTDAVTIPLTSADKGMLAYNIGTSMSNGLSIWNGTNWVQALTKVTGNTVNLYDLSTSTATIPVSGSAASLIVNGTPCNWMQPGVTESIQNIEVKEDGSYAFIVRAYGSISNSTSTGVGATYYFGLFKNGTTFVDSQEVTALIMQRANSSSSVASTSTVVLGGSFSAGDTFNIRVSQYDYPAGNSCTWTLSPGSTSSIGKAARTSLIFWKL